MKVLIYTLGCKVNQYESQAMETLFAQAGHVISDNPEECDAIIINSCAVTAESVRKSRQTVRRLKNVAPNAVIVLCGCWPQTDYRSAAESDADILFGNGKKSELPRVVEEFLADRRPIKNITDIFTETKIERLPSGNTASRTRALLRIEDGCDNFCSYCLIPYARGHVRSMPLYETGIQAQKLRDHGYREIVLTGIELASYGRDLEGKPSLSDALRVIASSAPECRIRLGSLEPRCITDDFCQVVAERRNICPHFHLSLQSGCEATLTRMNRKYTPELTYEKVKLLRKNFPNCGVTADLIVGFPGETDKEFDETMQFIEKCSFSSMHIFPFSSRSGTPAASMNSRIRDSVKRQRVNEAITLAEKMKKNFLKQQVGKTLPVLFETVKDGFWQGYSSSYCLVKSTNGEKNELRGVHIESVDGSCLIGS